MKIDEIIQAASQALYDLHIQQEHMINGLLTQVAIVHRQVAQATDNLRLVFVGNPLPAELATQPPAPEPVDDVLDDMLAAPAPQPPDPHEARIERLAQHFADAQSRLPPPLPATRRG